MYNYAKRLDGLSGSVIREILKLTIAPGVISFAGGNPSSQSFPKKQIEEITAKLLTEKPSEILQYGVTEGVPELKEFIKSFVGKRNIKINSIEELLILSGSSQGLELFTKSFINPGDYVAVENPSFLGALQTFSSYEAKLLPLSMDDDGIIIDNLEETLLKYKPKFLYAIPTFQNPTGKTMSLERRTKLLEIAARTNTLILEDDPYGELRYYGERVPSLKSLDKNDIVTYLGSFSKVIAPGLRVGYAIGNSEILRKMVIGKQGADVHTSNLSQHIVYEFAKDNLEDHIKNIIIEYKEKRDLMVKLLSDIPNIKVVEPDGGLFVWIEFPKDVDTKKLLEKAVENKVAFIPGNPFFSDGSGLNTMRLNFSNATLENIEIGINKLKAIL